MNIFKMFMLLFKRDPLKKEFRRAKRIRKHNAKGMTTYEKILSYPLEYGHKLDKYLKLLCEGDGDLYELLKNTHNENMKKFNITGDKTHAEISLNIAKNIWDKITIKDAIDLEIGHTNHFNIVYMRPYLYDPSKEKSEKIFLDEAGEIPEDNMSLGFDISAKEILLKPSHLNMPFPLKMYDDGLDNTNLVKTLSEMSASLIEMNILAKTVSEMSASLIEMNILNKLRENAKIVKTFDNVTSDDIKFLTSEIKNKAFLQKGKFYVLANEDTYKRIPENLDEELIVLKTESMVDDEILVIFITDNHSRLTIKTYLYSLNLDSVRISKDNLDHSLLINKRLETEIFSPYSFALIKLK